ncbi:MAG: hypothetical protein ACRDRH_05595 [Pseudonocardia sp.]
MTGTCPLGSCCLACRATTDLRVVVLASPVGPLCVTLDGRCAAGGTVLALTADAVLRLVLEHREHDRAGDPPGGRCAAVPADPGFPRAEGESPGNRASGECSGSAGTPGVAGRGRPG